MAKKSAISAKKRGLKRRGGGAIGKVLFIIIALAALAIYLYGSGGDTAAPTARRAAAPAAIAANEVRVHFIDLGQADGILIQSAQNAVLIDGGEYKTRETLADYLKNAGVTALDYVVATHPHSDHIGGLATVVHRFGVKNVLMPDAVHNSATFEKLLEAIEKKGISITVPKVGDRITAGIIDFTVLAPGKNPKDLNNASIVLRMAHGTTAFLFTGDAEGPSETEMINTKLNLRADVLKAGHHGSRTSSTAAFLDAVRPSAIVVTCGRDNSYGHPHKEFLERISQPGRNIALLRTDESGTVTISTDGKEITIYNANAANAERGASSTGQSTDLKAVWESLKTLIL
ncbi:MAG: MBL fold metallo-hydrolase [Chitinispirillia bacterium]|nr:MBL fold metallo-hydrolase [Chitinispirillia bacterium]MCL2241931.1 MBL fold metallo-hydrolase [Chitinispirillia bacterium]